MEDFDFDQIFEKFNYEYNKQAEGELAFCSSLPYANSQIVMHENLGINCFPYLGQYGEEYRWLTPIMALKCFPKTKEDKKKYVYNLMPLNFIYYESNEGQQNQKQFLSDRDTDYFILNYNASDFCKEKLKEYGDRYLLSRINMVCHSYLYPAAEQGLDIKENVVVSLYTQQNQSTVLSNLYGIEPNTTEYQDIKINRNNYLNQNNFIEVWLHPTDHQGSMAISPNNGTFLLNMTMPIVTLTLCIKAFQETQKNGVFHINIINNENYPNEHIAKLANAMQALTYIEDIAAEQEHNLTALRARQKYFKSIKQPVRDYLYQQRDVFKQNLFKLIKIEKPTFDQMFETIMDIKEAPEEDKCHQLYVEKYKDLFKMNVWDMFHQPNIDGFGEKYIHQLMQIEDGQIGQQHLIILIIKFLQKQLGKYLEIVNQQAILLCEDYSQEQNELQNLIQSFLNPEKLLSNQMSDGDQAENSQNQEESKAGEESKQQENGSSLTEAEQIVQADPKIDKELLAAIGFLKTCENPILQDLQEHMNDVFAQGDNVQVIETSLNKMRSRVFVDLICYLTWKHKGRVEGVHPDFGRLSYCRSNKIASNYHINDDDRAELLLNLSEKLSSM